MRKHKGGNAPATSIESQIEADRYIAQQIVLGEDPLANQQHNFPNQHNINQPNNDDNRVNQYKQLALQEAKEREVALLDKYRLEKELNAEKEKAKREEIEKNAAQRANRILQAENQLDWRLLRPVIKVPTAYDEYVMKEKMKKEVKDELKEEREKEKMRQKQIKELNAIWESPRAKPQKRSKSKPSKDRTKAKSPKRAKSPKKVKGKNKGKK